MDTFLESLLKVTAQQHQARQSDSSTAFLQQLDRVFLKLYAESDIMESVATRQLIHREAPLDKAT